MAHRARASFWTAGCPPLPASAPDRDAAEVLEYELPSRGSLSTSGQSVAMKFRTTERREDTRTAKSGHAPPKGRHSNPKGGQKRPKGGQKRPKSGQKRPKSGHPKVRRIILFLGGTALMVGHCIFALEIVIILGTVRARAHASQIPRKLPLTCERH